MRTAFAVLLVALAFAGAHANPSGYYGLVWYDDMSDPTGWTTVDNTAAAAPHFHLDTFMAYDDPDHEEDSSWWCGTLDYGSDGGYGNGWDDRLELPPVQVGYTVVEERSWGAIKSLYRDGEAGERSPARDPRPDVMPVLTFVYRHDSEVGYDFTYVEAESLGAWRPLNAGYDGSSGGWQDLGVYGYVLTEYGDPVKLRFRFISDGAWSDEDGLYVSDGGAFHVDNIRVFDFYGGETFFFDDAQDATSPCIPSVPGAAGDYWHLVDDVCSSNVIPSWWCGDDADTSLIPPNLNNALISPLITTGLDAPCTLRYAIHAEVPTVDNDFWVNSISTDGGVTWYDLSAYWGDFEQCSGFGTAGLNGDDISEFMPTNAFRYRLTFHTTDNGCGPGAAGGAGINLDDTWLEGLITSRSGPLYPEETRRSLNEFRRRAVAIPESPYRFF